MKFHLQAIERPAQHEYPAQNWIDWSDSNHGVALLNVGLPGSNVTDGTLMLSLMRSARVDANADINGPLYDLRPGIGSGPAANVSLRAGAARGSWQESHVFQAGLEFNRPLLVRTLDQHSGKLAKTWSMLQVSSPNVVLSALTPAEDGNGLIARVYEAAGQPATHVRIQFVGGIRGASEVNLIEEQLEPVAVKGDSVQFDLRPFEIKTFRLQLPDAIQ